MYIWGCQPSLLVSSDMHAQNISLEKNFICLLTFLALGLLYG